MGEGRGERDDRFSIFEECDVADRNAKQLLIEALAFFNDVPRFRRCGRSSYELASRIEAHLAELQNGEAAISEARQRWALSGFIRVDPDEAAFDETDDGYWVRGWVRIGKAGLGDTPVALRDHYEAAVSSLPLFTREVFNAHRLEELHYDAIANRYGIDRREVERVLATALLEISRALMLKD